MKLFGNLFGNSGTGNDDDDDDDYVYVCPDCSTKMVSDGSYIECPKCGYYMDIEDYERRMDGRSIEDDYPSEEEVLLREREDNGGK